MLANRYCSDTYEAEDAVQEALIRAWRKREELREAQHLWPWLARIVINETLRIQARRRPEPVADLEPLGMGEDGRLLSAPARIDLQRGLETLDAGERSLLRLRYELDLTQATIADRLNVPEGTIKVRLHRARARLERALREKEVEQRAG